MFDQPKNPTTPLSDSRPLGQNPPSLPPLKKGDRGGFPESAALSVKPVESSTAPVPPPPKIPVEGPKAPLAKEPEDIFAETGEAIKPKAPLMGEPALSPEAPLAPMISEGGLFSRNKKIIVPGLVVLAVIVVVIFAVWQFWGGKGGAKKPVLPPAVTSPEAPAVPAPEPGAPAANVNTAPELSVIDTDRDGLSNLEENKLGTDSKKPDTDNDGLSDYEEVKVYKTDPLNPDSDGDRYLDGEEVKNGYSPLGPGKLIDLEKELEKLK